VYWADKKAVDLVAMLVMRMVASTVAKRGTERAVMMVDLLEY
jgi:hypothetical protein